MRGRGLVGVWSSEGPKSSEGTRFSDGAWSSRGVV